MDTSVDKEMEASESTEKMDTSVEKEMEASESIDKESYDISESAQDERSFPSVFRSKNTEKYQTQFSVIKMCKLIEKMTEQQKAIVRKHGFGSLLLLKCTSYPKGVVFSLAKNYDPSTRSFRICDGVSFRVDPLSVHSMLGTPLGGPSVPNTTNWHAATIIAADTGQGSCGAKIDDLIALVTPSLTGDKFMRIFMLIAISVFLCPSCNPRISPKWYAALCVVKDINSYNWSAKILDWLHDKIVSFQHSLLKGNSSGTAGLGGCLFIIFAGFFDYLVTNEPLVDDSLPRISAWDNSAIKRYAFAELQMDTNELKPVTDTLFQKKYLDNSKLRGFSITTVSKATIRNMAKTPEQHRSKSIKGTSCAKEQSFIPDLVSSFNELSVQKIVGEKSKLSLDVLCGEKLHPDVCHFIKSTIPGNDNEQIRKNMAAMCQSFYKNSVQRYIEAVDSVIVEQSCEMVQSLLSSLQPPAHSTIFAGNETTSPIKTPDSDGFQVAHKQSVGIAACTERGDKDVATSVSKINLDEELENNVDKLGKDDMLEARIEIDAALPQTCSNQGVLTEKSEPIPMSTPLISEMEGQSYAQSTLKDEVQGDMSGCVPKRQLLFAEEKSNYPVGSPEKKMPTDSNEEDGGAKDDMKQDSKAHSDPEDHNLSSMLHRKRLLKLPASLASPNMSAQLPARNIKVPAIQKSIFNIVTKRVKGDDGSNVAAQIGRYYVTQAELSNSMRARQRVISTTMDVYCEALNHDERTSTNTKLSKCFLTSEVVDKLKKEDFHLDQLESSVDPMSVGFTITECDMIMIPVCHSCHWWVLVANIRDRRFDVLSSLTLSSDQKNITKIICRNFQILFESLDNGKRNIDISAFDLQYQMVPQQITIYDCGIYSMDFMATWNGRKVSPISNDQVHLLPQKLTAYIVCHGANLKTLPEISTLIYSQKSE